MFQRQLSTTALLGSGSSSSSSPSGASRLFQRQLTASQLFSSSAEQSARLAQRPPSGSAAARLAESGEQRREKPAAKNRRIISRMLSISAIHSGDSASSPAGFGSSPGSAGSSSQQLEQSSAELNQSTDSALPQVLASQLADQTTPDRIDSSFTRSRSSSSSSTIPQAAGAGTADSLPLGSSSSELLLCLCFLDQSALLAPFNASQQQSGASTQPASVQVQGSPSSASSPSNKSPNPNAPESCTGQQLALWLGTSHGSVLLLSLSMPDTEDNRVLQLQSVQVEPIPQAAIKMPGALLSLALFSSEASRAPSSGGNLASQSSSLESEQATGSSACPANPSASGASSGAPGDSSTSSGSLDSRVANFLSVVSTKEARVYQIPAPILSGRQVASSASSEHHSHQQRHHHHSTATQPPAGSTGCSQQEWPLARLLHNQKQLVACAELSESSFAAQAALVQMRSPDETCLAVYLATGSVRVLSLPALRPSLMDADFVPYSESLARSMRFSRNGHALYRPSPGELCKFSLSAQYGTLVNEMTGALYVAREMPEQPRANFFKSLFSVTSSVANRHSDRDELFSECAAGKAPRTVAKHISAATTSQQSLDKLKGAVAGTAGYELRAAREGLDERGEKLSELEDRTLQMMNQSESYSQAAHQLAQKFKDKKWYQF